MSAVERQPTPERTRATYTPTLEQARELARLNTLIPIYRTLPADLETPVTAYVKLTSEKTNTEWSPSFLLESVEGGNLGRYSFLVTAPKWGIELPTEGGWVERQPNGSKLHNPGEVVDPLIPIEERTRRQVARVPGLPRFHGGFVGYIGFETVRAFERKPTLQNPKPSTTGVPDAVLAQVDDLVAFDHVTKEMKVITHLAVEDPQHIDAAYGAAVERIETLVDKLRKAFDPKTLISGTVSPLQAEPTSNFERTAYEKMVVEALRKIIEGEVIQVVVSQRWEQKTSADPFKIYRARRRVDPSPFQFFFNYGEFQLIGASPELLVKVENGKVTTWPLAGTRPRSPDATPEEDAAVAEELLNDPKERAEHLMLVDLGRNDIGRVAIPGTMKVDKFMEPEFYSNVIHLASRVEGSLRPGLTSFDALRACFPAGTVSGAPKIRAIELIYEFEPDRRGPYAGAIGFISYSGGLEMAITIRNGILKNRVFYNQAGGGIVSDSVPATEYEETRAKARGGFRAVKLAEEEEF